MNQLDVEAFIDDFRAEAGEHVSLADPPFLFFDLLDQVRDTNVAWATDVERKSEDD